VTYPPSQLTLDGCEVELPLRRPRLTDRQREVLRFVRAVDYVRPWRVGVMMHAGRASGPTKRHPIAVLLTGRPCCRYASSDGFDALRRLERRGLVERRARGQWVATQHVEDW